ncbi:hypothetical protein H2199_009055 [Coniosporium tulheliwenetii]|uniref:Uncharacterized protein n=1 Tax=Coniosporium tulheliwenetii TaxID=3383036 RepID=A0ACC2YGA2_9PEZI|nr:hypothetical protein H2199_009055 [Cladosporium sp. JES 115]
MQDKSAYWTPPLMFLHSNGTAEVVPEYGLVVYYSLNGDNIQTFPEGFQIIAGAAMRRSFTPPIPDPPKSGWTAKDMTQQALAQRATGCNCLTNQIDKIEGAHERHFLHEKSFLDANCNQGLRMELMFLSCWNGKDIDLPDHKSHLAYPNLVNLGEYPPGFETRVPSLLYESYWDTYKYKDVDRRFVIGNGDTTDYGFHGDFMIGWDAAFLQKAIDTCTNPSGNIEGCPLFKIQSPEDAARCHFVVPEPLIADECGGPRKGLCGNVTVDPSAARKSRLFRM